MDKIAAVQLGAQFVSALAGAKEGVFQLFMSQMAHCSVLQSLPAAGGRLWQSWRRLAWPQLLSLADFRKLPGRRVVRMLECGSRV